MDHNTKSTMSTWRVDDLDAGLADGISNIQGLGDQVELLDNDITTPAYDMTEVLRLQLFKEEMLDGSALLESLNESMNTRTSYIHTPLDTSIETIQQMEQMTIPGYPTEYLFSPDNSKCIKTETADSKYDITLKAPTAPGRKLQEETLTWLNQGQPYEIVLKSINHNNSNIANDIKGVISVGFQQRQDQYFEVDKYDEWEMTRPNEKMVELDFPRCYNVQEPSHVGLHTNEIEFKWDTSTTGGLFLKFNCLSSEFTKGKGESGVPLRLLVEFYNSADCQISGEPDFAAGCQVKVFRAKGANRKLKLQKEKHESLSKEEANQVQQSNDETIFKRVECVEKSRRRSSEVTNIQCTTTEYSSLSGISPTQLSQLRIVNGNGNTSISSPDLQSAYMPSPAEEHLKLTANCSVEETQRWLTYHRFQNHLNCFSNFTGADLLRLSRNDLIQLCGPADGIRLNNVLKARASRPLLTMYISPEWHQSGTGMREYHAMFLEQLTVQDLKRKLSKKCGIQEEKIIGILKQGPTGIHIHIDDDVVRNFVDEAHHVVEVLKDPNSEHSRIILK